MSLWDVVASGRRRGGESCFGVLAACVRAGVLSAMGMVFSGCAVGERIRGERLGVFVGVLSSSLTGEVTPEVFSTPVEVSPELDSSEDGGRLLVSSGLEILEKSVSSM